MNEGLYSSVAIRALCLLHHWPLAPPSSYHDMPGQGHWYVRSPLVNRCLFYRNRRKSVRIQIPLGLFLSGIPEDKPSDGAVPALELTGSGLLSLLLKKQS